MSDDFLGPDGSDGWSDDGGSRRRAAWALTVLALAAVVIIALITILVGTSPTKHTTVADVGSSSSSRPDTTSAAPSTASSSTASSSASSSPSASSSASSSAAPNSKSCPSAAPCIIPGDDGGALDAANALRRTNGLPGVPGAVTTDAQRCALAQGSGPTCVPHYAWQPLSSQDGKACVAAVSPSWILDPSIKTLSVGWALIGGQWQCALLKAP